MAFYTKTLSNGREVGITNCEMVLPLSALRGLADQEIIALVRELESDLEFVKDYLGGDEIGYGTIEELKQFVIRQKQKKRTLEVKRGLTQQRRREFDSRRAQLTLMLIERDGYICKFPNCHVQEGLTIDHIVPLSKGGSDELENLQFLCRKHNSSKGDFS
jgi:5-methylcytosine-specific restriction endonuclease McrA